MQPASDYAHLFSDHLRGITSGPALPKPIWHCLLTPPGSELAARQFLRRRGVFAFFPVEQCTRRDPRCTRKRRTWQRAIVPGYLFTQFRAQPNWDVLTDQRFISGVLTSSGRPYAFPRAIIRRMQGLPVEVADMLRASQDLRTIMAGDNARFAQGPLSGYLVLITKVSGKTATFESPDGTLRGTAKTDALDPA